LSSSGAEGLDFNFIRTVHILEPYWNFSRIEQIRSRAIRYKSHSLLPKNNRNVRSFVYISTLKTKQLVTDEEIYDICMDKQKYVDDFLHLIRQTAVDCTLHYNNCIKCDAINKPLYWENFNTDIQLPNPCNKTDLNDVNVEHYKDDIYYSKETKKYYKLKNGQLIEI